MGTFPNPPIVTGAPNDGDVVAWSAARGEWVPVAQSGGSNPSTLASAEYKQAVTVADSAMQTFAAFPVGFFTNPPLALTDPQNPSVTAAGIYAVSCVVEPADNTTHAGKTLALHLDLDANDFDWYTKATTPMDTAGYAVTCSQTVFLAEGAVLNAAASHDVGGDVDLVITTSVQRIA